MNLFITDLRLLRRSGVSEGVPQALPQAMVEAAMMGGLVDGMPFILDDDGAYDLDLNRFFRACPTMGIRSMHSVKAYALAQLSRLGRSTGKFCEAQPQNASRINGSRPRNACSVDQVPCR